MATGTQHVTDELMTIDDIAEMHKCNLMEYVGDMIESLEVMTIQAGGEVIRKLARAAEW